MAERNAALVLKFPTRGKRKQRKGLNKNKFGSIIKANGNIHFDFYYLDERVRAGAGLRWNEENRKQARKQLDSIQAKIQDKSFRFAEEFPGHNKSSYFTEKENKLYGIVEVITPDKVQIQPYINKWFELLKESGRVRQRTLHGYKSYIDNYYTFFSGMAFSELNKVKFDEFRAWLRRQKLRGKSVSNKTINKVFVPLKMICNDVAAEYGWGRSYDPFFGYKRLKEQDAYKRINPFSFEQQKKVIAKLPEHYRPFFEFAFATGIRTGEQIAVKLSDINWQEKTLRIDRAMTLDLEGKKIEDETKNEYSQRTLHLQDFMFEILLAQKRIYDSFKKKPVYFFCTPKGKQIHISNVRRRVWIPALDEAKVDFREMYQTRHTFATVALASGETPLWIANFMGHRNTEMVIKVYSKYVKKLNLNDGKSLAERYRNSNNTDDKGE